ncbi:MAG: DnaB-like helicase N-terminal domain-containing protein [Nakamurella sp.]
MLPNRNRPAAFGNRAATIDELAGASLHIVDGSSDSATGPEFATVGAIILAVAAVQDEALAIAQDDDFGDPRCAFVVGAIREMRAEHLPVDMVTIVGYVRRHSLLDGGAPRVNLASWLHEMTCAAPVPASAPWYADQVVEAAARRRAQHAAAAISAAAEGGSLAEPATDELTAVTAAVARVAGGGGLHV